MALRQFPSPALGWQLFKQTSGQHPNDNQPAKFASRQNWDALGRSLYDSSLTGVR